MLGRTLVCGCGRACVRSGTRILGIQVPLVQHLNRPSPMFVWANWYHYLLVDTLPPDLAARRGFGLKFRYGPVTVLDEVFHGFFASGPLPVESKTAFGPPFADCHTHRPARRGAVGRGTARRPGGDLARPALTAHVIWHIIKEMAARTAGKTRFPAPLCLSVLFFAGGLIGGLAELLGGALAGFPSHLKLRLHFLKIATAPGEILFDSAEGFTVLLQASLQPLLCLRSLIQSLLRTVE